jgi:hypothetical protein
MLCRPRNFRRGGSRLLLATRIKPMTGMQVHAGKLDCRLVIARWDAARRGLRDRRPGVVDIAAGLEPPTLMQPFDAGGAARQQRRHAEFTMA